MLEYVMTEEDIMALVIAALHRQSHAQLELEMSAEITMRKHFGQRVSDYHEYGFNAMYNFGKSVFDILQRANVYYRGILPYEFVELLGGDVMIERLDASLIEEDSKKQSHPNLKLSHDGRFTLYELPSCRNNFPQQPVRSIIRRESLYLPQG